LTLLRNSEADVRGTRRCRSLVNCQISLPPKELSGPLQRTALLQAPGRLGTPGTGKAFLLEALGQLAVEQGLYVAWLTLEGLVPASRALAWVAFGPAY
jgi:hypothetical protein